MAAKYNKICANAYRELLTNSQSLEAASWNAVKADDKSFDVKTATQVNYIQLIQLFSTFVINHVTI